MENHPVPQNISSYEFRLVGDMTLKQFLQLAAGIVVGVIIFRLQLIPIIKYPLSGLSVLLGVLMAFVPINGRPFTSWLVAFVKAIYSPTEYVWVPEDLVNPPLPVSAPVSAPAVPAQTVAIAPAAPPVKPAPPPKKPVPPEVSPVLPSFSDFLSSKAQQNQPAIAQKETTVSKMTVRPLPPTPVSPAPGSTTLKPGQTIPISQSVAPTSQIAPDFPSVQTGGTSAPAYTQATSLPKTESIVSAPSAVTTSMISPPTKPNILSGILIDSENLPLPQITVEIIDVKTGIPARALRSNKLGQFQIAIPLPPGTYNVVAEKDGLKFDPVSVQIKGGVIPPVIIQGKPA